MTYSHSTLGFSDSPSHSTVVLDYSFLGEMTPQGPDSSDSQCIGGSIQTATRLLEKLHERKIQLFLKLIMCIVCDVN